ncbi:MAG: ATP-binding protein [Chloroflexota bacterium]
MPSDPVASIRNDARMLDEILAAATDLIFVIGAPGHCLYANRAAEKALGLKPGDRIDRALSAIGLSESSRETFDRQKTRVFESGQPITSEVSYPSASGIRECEYTISPLHGADRSLPAVVVTGHDVTDRVISDRQKTRLLIREQALADIAQALVREVELPRVIDVVMTLTMSLLRASAVGVWLADPSRRELTMVDWRGKTPEARQLLGTISYDAPSLSARAARTGEPQVIDDAAAIPPELTFTREVAGRERVKSVLSLPLRSRGQLIGVVTYASPVPRHFSRSDLGFNLTVADLFAVAIDNAQLLQKVRQALRLREEFMAAAAHELRTPLTVIKGRTQWLLRAGAKDAASRGALEAIARHVERMVMILDDLLSVIRVRPGGVSLRLEQFDLSALTRDLTARTASTTREHHFRIDGPEALIIKADRELIGEVITHLLENAMRYSPSGGEIDVTALRHNDEAIVAVTDRGVGVPEERQPFVFEPFYELVPPGEPGYLGIVPLDLYLSKQIVDASGGRIWFESAPGLGSTFSFSLPLAK